MFYDLEKDTEIVHNSLKAFQTAYKLEPFVLGEKLTVCDLLAFSEILDINVMDFPMEECYPRIWAWMKRVYAYDPYVREVHHKLHLFCERSDVKYWMTDKTLLEG